MSASEKLKALRLRGHHLYLNGVDVDIEDQIVAVVEAAEKRCNEEPEFTSSKAHANAANALVAALAALEKALA